MSRTFMEIMTDLDNIKEELDEKIFNEVVAKPKTSEWVPCSERLPEIDESCTNYDRYLVQYGGGGIDVCYWTNASMIRSGLTTEPYWTKPSYNEVVAWMPLPEPYEAS